ncbi:MAG: AAA family ATPase [candidate division KSB1 bacterium]|nr:AAA family ATPase [candidate division KSB1 bacterium]MDZ7274597.1 AAA family ATPase [candidate division KSB1 bacterium]MDZ7284742.1 AAA family ATPase [candidate division KSB1 bacterium]MDZ7297838.1 AAA family ATPase [candidate division KSB1 bacterium]MDZ7308879.1 AAA family ATPase [candidate division KSB1 bacterium]
MLTKLTIKNFKLFTAVEIELGQRVVFIGPNNSGKTSALQALALWEAGVKRWLEKRGNAKIPAQRAGVTLNRQDLIAIPLPSAKLLWRDLHVRTGERQEGKASTRNVLIEIGVEGVKERAWQCCLEFDYANEESFYCRPPLVSDNQRMEVPGELRELQVAYLPPMSGLAAREDRLEMGSIRVRLGEGRTAEVLRNLCWQVLQGRNGEEKWQEIADLIGGLFGSRLSRPQYVAERGEITMEYRTRDGTVLDISASGRGEQQTLLLLAHMAANPGAVLLLDEPDAHLEILRQRQIYEILSRQAEKTNSQIIAASHSEVLLNEAAGRDVVIAFVGPPHRLDTRGSQVLKALREIRFEDYYLAEETGWVLYLEGATDLAMLRAFADRLQHEARVWLERPFVHYVGNQPRKAQEHFYALREAKGDLIGIAIYDRLDSPLPDDPKLVQRIWQRRELENYLCQRETLLAYAENAGRMQFGELFRPSWRDAMAQAIAEVEKALLTLGKDPWSADLKASEEFLDPVFKRFHEKLALPNLMSKTNYHVLVKFVPGEAIAAEIREMLDAIVAVAGRARPRE